MVDPPVYVVYEALLARSLLLAVIELRFAWHQVLKCVNEVALYDKGVMAFVKCTPEDERFEGIPDALFVRVVKMITSARLQPDDAIKTIGAHQV